MKKICVLTIGCPKNIVDSEKIISALPNTFIFTESVDDAEIIILNTCGFIQSAINETLEYIHKLEKVKEINPNVKIIIYGCAVTRLINEGFDLKNEFKFVSNFVSLANKNSLLSLIEI
jgi:tRNA A37 methylthiotransferase MiaB